MLEYWRATRPFGDTQHNFQNADSKFLNDELLEIFVWVYLTEMGRANRSRNFERFRRWKFFNPSRDGGEKSERFFGRNAKSGRPSCQVVARDAPDFDHEGRPLSLISLRIGFES